MAHPFSDVRTVIPSAPAVNRERNEMLPYSGATQERANPSRALVWRVFPRGSQFASSTMACRRMPIIERMHPIMRQPVRGLRFDEE